MGRERIETGRFGEDAAVKALRRKGYAVRGRNVRTPFGELDIIATRGNVTVFIEVRTRTTSSFGPPSLSVTWKKQLHLVRNALYYLKWRGLVDSVWRIDVITVKMDIMHRVENIEIIENAVQGDYQ